MTGNTGTVTGTGTGGTGTQGGMTGVGMVTSIPGSSFTGTGNTHFEIINYVIFKRIFIIFTLYVFEYMEYNVLHLIYQIKKVLP